MFTDDEKNQNEWNNENADKPAEENISEESKSDEKITDSEKTEAETEPQTEAEAGTEEKPETETEADAKAETEPSGEKNNENIYRVVPQQTEHSFETKPKKKVGLNVATVAIVLVCVCIFSAVIGIGGWRLYESMSNSSQSTATAETTEPASTDPAATTGKTTPASTEATDATATSEVVPAGDASISGAAIPAESTKTSDTSTAVTDMLEDCLKSSVIVRLYKNGTYLGAGSGVIYTKDGYIITNYHVASSTALSGYDIEITLYDGSVYMATYVCGDMETDIAVVKIDKNDCAACTIGNSNETKMGETIYVIGNPNNQGIIVTDGVVSSLSRTATVSSNSVTLFMSGLFQVSAQINSGNSGGGVFNAKGELIGIVNSKRSYDSSGNVMEGFGTCIPIAKAMNCINTLVANNGYIPGRAKLGVIVSVNGVTLSSGWTSASYTVVTGIQEGSAAEAAGIQEGDIIYALDGTNLKTCATQNSLQSDYDALHYLLLSYSVGDTATLTVLRQTTTGGRTTYEEVEVQVTFVDFNSSVID